MFHRRCLKRMSRFSRSRFPAFGFLGSGKHGEGNTFLTKRLDALRRRISCLDEHSWCFGGEIFSVPSHLYSFIIFVVPMICGDPVVSGKNTCQHCPYYKAIKNRLAEIISGGVPVGFTIRIVVSFQASPQLICLLFVDIQHC